MSEKKRKTRGRVFKRKAVRLIAEKSYGIAETSRNLGVEYSLLCRWGEQLADDPQNALPGKDRLKAPDEEPGQVKRKLERVIEARGILKKALACFAEDQK
ncbi:MAG: hypothetical protein DSY90_09930 [Deltaproteobacteria bacterium]|nr:MAG: hypothetical protein DSY90_09930 [Deltaproteobacteria bacterium]